jgi:hypothetical protein
MHPLGLLGPSISAVGPCLAVVWLVVGAAPSLLRPSLLISLVLARHWAGGSLNDGSVMGDYRFKLMEQF